MKTSTITANLKSDINKVWSVVTDNRNYQWRSDLSKIEISDDGNKFTEYTANGFATRFAITLMEPPHRYEFDIENKNMYGHWTGVFTETESGTKIKLTEEINVKNPIMNLFAGSYLKKQQKKYVMELKCVLGEL